MLSIFKDERNIVSISQAAVKHRKYAAQVCVMMLFSRDKIDQIIVTASRALHSLDAVLYEFNKYESELKTQEATTADKKNRKTMLEQVEDVFEMNDELKENLSIADSN